MTDFGPLAGVRLIEMDAIGPVPLAGMILSGLGADIIRIERPAGQHAFADLGDAVLMRGRTRVELDLKNSDDRETLLQFVDHADGLMEGLRPGVMERLGIGPAPCLARNPRLVYGRMTGWGQEGPWSRQAGHDINYIAMTGALHAIAQKNSPPTVPLNIVGDYAGGSMFLALGMLAGVICARETGRGQVVDAAIVDGVANLMALFQAHLSTGVWSDAPASNMLDGAAPFYRCYECADGGFVAVGALEPQFYSLLMAGLKLDEAAFNRFDKSAWPALEAAIAGRFLTAARDHWEVVFSGVDACVAPVLSMTEAFSHPANVARGVFVTRDGVRQAAPAPRFAVTPGAVREGRKVSKQAALDGWRRA